MSVTSSKHSEGVRIEKSKKQAEILLDSHFVDFSMRSSAMQIRLLEVTDDIIFFYRTLVSSFFFEKTFTGTHCPWLFFTTWENGLPFTWKKCCGEL